MNQKAELMPVREIGAVGEDERRELATVVESMVVRGDVSGLTAEERVRHYMRLCERLRLDPSTQPLMLLRLNGRDIYYPTKGASDQLAAVWGVDRRMVERPGVVEIPGAGKIIRAVCEAHWRGRVDTSTGAVPMPNGGGEALCNALLKCESKAKRRATLSILGLGMLSEDEVESIPAREKSAPSAAPADRDVPLAIADAAESYDDALTVDQAGAIWEDHRAAITADNAEDVQRYLLARCPAGTSKAALKRAIAAASAPAHPTRPAAPVEARDWNAAATDDAPPPAVDPPDEHALLATFRGRVAECGDLGALARAWRDSRTQLLEVSKLLAADGWNVAVDRVLALTQGRNRKAAGAALKAAVEALEPRPTPPTGTDAPANDAPAAATGDAREATPAQGAQASAADAWRAHLLTHTALDAVANSTAKALALGTYALDERAMRTIAAERMQALDAACTGTLAQNRITVAVKHCKHGRKAA